MLNYTGSAITSLEENDLTLTLELLQKPTNSADLELNAKYASLICALAHLTDLNNKLSAQNIALHDVKSRCFNHQDELMRPVCKASYIDSMSDECVCSWCSIPLISALITSGVLFIIVGASGDSLDGKYLLSGCVLIALGFVGSIFFLCTGGKISGFCNMFCKCISPYKDVFPNDRHLIAYKYRRALRHEVGLFNKQQQQLEATIVQLGSTEQSIITQKVLEYLYQPRPIMP